MTVTSNLNIDNSSQVLIECLELIEYVLSMKGAEQWAYDVDECISMILNTSKLTNETDIINHVGDILITLIYSNNFINSLIPFTMMASTIRLKSANSLSVCA